MSRLWAEDRVKLLRDRARRNEEILALRASGHTLLEIGDTFGITRERVRQIVQESRRRIARNAKSLSLPEVKP